MQGYGEAAGIPPEKRHFLVLKHSIVTHLLNAGADVSFLKDWPGHSTIQNTMVYARLPSRTGDEQARGFSSVTCSCEPPA